MPGHLRTKEGVQHASCELAKALGGMILAAGASVAVPVLLGSTASANSGGRYCVESVTPGSTATCFSSFGASISFATGGRVNLANAAVSRDVSASELGETTTPASTNSVPLGSLVLAIDYATSSYRGTTLTWTGSGCSSTIGGGNIPSWFNDTAQSVHAYSGCATTLFWNANYGPPSYPVHVNGSVATMGSFNNEASSQLFCDYYGCA